MGVARSRQSHPSLGHKLPIQRSNQHSSSAATRSATGAPSPAPTVGRLAQSTIQRAQSDPSSLSPNNVMTLQRTLGNSAVTRMISHSDSSTPNVQTKMPIVQTKLMVGESNDGFEQEADTVARQVVSRIHGDKAVAALPSTAPAGAPPLQRQEGEEAEAVSLAASAEGGEVEPELAGEIQSARNGGKAMEKPVRSAMESAFGADFSGVRVHETPQADSINRSINARAFTSGQDLFFRQGSYNPNSVAGQGLLAHELTHVVQQGAATQSVQRQESAPEDRLPSAHSVAKSSRALGQSPQVSQHAGTGRIHRCNDDKKKKKAQNKSKPIDKGSEEKRRSITLDHDEDNSSQSHEPMISPVISETKKDEESPPIIVKKTTGSVKPPKKKQPPQEEGPGKGSSELSEDKNLKSDDSVPVDTNSDIKMTGKAPTTSGPPVSGVGNRDTTSAKGVINSSGMDLEYKLRALDLLDDPNKASQAGYGICGLTSVLRAILISDPDRFATIAIQAMADVETMDKWHDFFQDHADEEQQEEQKELDFIVAQWIISKSTTGMVSQTALKPKNKGGYSSVTKTKDFSEVAKHQVDFSNTFNMPTWKEDGHYATTSGGLNYLYGALTGKKGYKIKVTNFAMDYARAKSKAGENGTINASIKGHDFYKAEGKRVRKPPAEKHPAKYRHWVTILSSKRVNVKNKDGNVSKYFKMKIWTYEQFWDAKVREDVVGSYIHSLLVM